MQNPCFYYNPSVWQRIRGAFRLMSGYIQEFTMRNPQGIQVFHNQQTSITNYVGLLLYWVFELPWIPHHSWAFEAISRFSWPIVLDQQSGMHSDSLDFLGGVLDQQWGIRSNGISHCLKKQEKVMGCQTGCHQDICKSGVSEQHPDVRGTIKQFSVLSWNHWSIWT